MGNIETTIQINKADDDLANAMRIAWNETDDCEESRIEYASHDARTCSLRWAGKQWEARGEIR